MDDNVKNNVDSSTEEVTMEMAPESNEVDNDKDKSDDILDAVLDAARKSKKNKRDSLDEALDFDDYLLAAINLFDEEAMEKHQKSFEPKEKKVAKKVDISSISISNKSSLEKEKELKIALFGNKSAFQIVAAQSGYNATVAPLVNKDVYNIINSNLNRYQYKRAVYEVLWSKIIETSVGKMDFETWLKKTSVEDAETFYYGLYCATFQNQKAYNFKCYHCGEESEYSIVNTNLIKTADTEEMKNLIQTINSSSDSVKCMEENSLLGKNDVFELSDSGLLVEIRTPSLADSLELLKNVSEETIDKDINSVTNMLYVNRFLVPDSTKTSYSEQTDRMKILRIIDNLSIDDANELQDTIDERLDTHRITYSIKNLQCPLCRKKILEIPVNIEDILFTAIFGKLK